ncbi:O-antigen ligase family protein [Oxalobacteraceae bacterium CAVE-383]|nr:O-antigen ligase family protein [Oxalobacteraceae bacterium CAVE-383]
MHYLQRPIAIALAAFYVLALVLDRAAGVIFALLALAGLAAIGLRAIASGKSFGQMMKAYWPLHLAMAAPLIAVLCNQAASGRFAGRSIDLPLRLALFALVFWAIVQVPYRYLKHLQWAFAVGAFGAALKIHLLTGGGDHRYATDFIPIGIFAEMGLLLGIFSAFALVRWNAPGRKWAILLGLTGACAGVYTAYLSGSRGTWVTIPFFALIACISARHLSHRHKSLIAALCIAALSASFFYGKIAEERVLEIRSDIQGYEQGTVLDSSIGTRFQLWKGSWILFKEHPVFGVGPENYRAALHELSTRNIITPDAAGFAHSHNEILFMMVKLGAFGLLAILAVYFVPMFYFGRDLRHDDREVRGAAAMGMALCAGIALLGLTDVAFLWWEIFPFYAIGVALFLACMIKRKEDIISASGRCSATARPIC